MKIRYYKDLDNLRWIGFLLSVIAVFILTDKNPNTMLGWSISSLSCGLWVYFAYKDRDTPRTVMELMYLLLEIRGVMNG